MAKLRGEVARFERTERGTMHGDKRAAFKYRLCTIVVLKDGSNRRRLEGVWADTNVYYQDKFDAAQKQSRSAAEAIRYFESVNKPDKNHTTGWIRVD